MKQNNPNMQKINNIGGKKFLSTKKEIAEDFANSIKSDKIKLMILFGSVARGDYRPDSDIDILVVSDYQKKFGLKSLQL